MKSIIICFFISVLSIESFSQLQPVDITERTFKIAGMSSEELYFGFQEGDQIVFTFLEIDNKPLKEVEIIEMPSSSKYMEYETRGFSNKTVNVSKKSIYKFPFYNSAISGRVCKIKIQRIPSSEEFKNFNTNVIWKTLYDTVHYIVQERYLFKIDTTLVNVCDQMASVHSSTVMSGTPSRNIVDFILPANTISFSYYIGVDEAGKKAYDEANQKFLNSTSQHVGKIPPYGPLVALALDGASFFTSTAIGENVKYHFLSDYNSAQNFMYGLSFFQYKQGDVVSDQGRLSFPNQAGRYYIGLYNDNIKQGINVNVKIIAVTVVNIYSTRDVAKYKVTSKDIAYHE
ncbi:hypothetical protein [Cytophaga hutchinsonii]|uniref:Uncharacterized protein n=1 Tax=Cytophaga hutchinsonii (strain ATCC 33406 / DSM 1761 / CIP 103989 / NBRC 15051 / NCIMB 9469 / D465) TaxID=269798 RepID=A0A6N4SNC3_CYTH3|nr:hypothetical protein [Cytophaga hutchinsonii]ABG57789.1 hypothetical protein CHU_0500 [Cytophaga hutchinsonii ATCC 33406]SFX05637.1 hypothetical protein SAMN04487930_101341 [Cytophaga hutchinsonii ATCC 33406]